MDMDLHGDTQANRAEARCSRCHHGDATRRTTDDDDDIEPGLERRYTNMVSLPGTGYGYVEALYRCA